MTHRYNTSGLSGNRFSLRFLLLFGFFCLIQSSSFAQLQELELITIENPNRAIPVFRDYPDDAAIIVTSSLTNLQFDSNVGIVADLSSANDGEYRLVIPPFRQSITVNAPGYRQLRFTVPITGPRDVKVYEVRPLQQQEDLIPIVLNISPLDAIVFIDEQGIDINRATRLSPGPHTIRIEKDGFKTISEVITIDENSFRFDYTLEQLQPVPVTFTTNPGQASIEINNVLRANDNFQDFYFPGEYFVRISKTGYRTINQTVTVVENPAQDPLLNVFNFE
ncbi:MAG: PEGA domain-containing protein, partial [Balneolales bacterium]|nr:PEGA domain-containing protein [Balneolales bacterium]